MSIVFPTSGDYTAHRGKFFGSTIHIRDSATWRLISLTVYKGGVPGAPTKTGRQNPVYLEVLSSTFTPTFLLARTPLEDSLY